MAVSQRRLCAGVHGAGAAAGRGASGTCIRNDYMGDGCIPLRLPTAHPPRPTSRLPAAPDVAFPRPIR